MFLRERLRPWHALMAAAFAVGAASHLRRVESVGATESVTAVASGLLAVVVFQFTVGNVWGYAVEYRNAGGGWIDAPLVAPFAVAAVAGVALWLQSGSIALGAWGAFWAFVVGAALIAVGVRIVAGYRDATA